MTAVSVYIDTSALGRVLLGEPGAASVAEAMIGAGERFSSRLLRAELRRLAARHARLGTADELLSGVALVPLERSILDTAETITPAGVATLDAIHLATAVMLAKDGVLETVMTYDARLAAGARHHGLEVLAPS